MPPTPERAPSGEYDLHTHSHISDGTTSPSEIVALAAKLQLQGVALTDHDTAAGWEEARAAARQHSIDFLPGIELTTHTGTRSAHILAYGPDPEHAELAEAMAQLRDSRTARITTMAALLAPDYHLDWDRVIAEAGASAGRPHLADALVAAGYVQDRSTAFRTVLHARSQYYRPIATLDTVRAIEIVRAAGGVTVLAHPAAERQRTPFSVTEFEPLLRAGLWGVELDHPENNTEWLAPLRHFAAERGLVVTGASDFHGAGKVNRLGERRSSAQLVAQLRALVAVPR